jgi:predicted ATPase
LYVPVGFGRTLEVRRWAATRTGGRAARFSFDELCAATLGPVDYLALAGAFEAVFVESVPALSMGRRDRARRFITLVDELYNAGRTLVVSAAAAPEALFRGAGGGGGGKAGKGGAVAGGAGAGAEGPEDLAGDEEPILDLEQLMFETAAEDARLRRDVTASGGVAPVASSDRARAAAAAVLGGEEERFAFARAVSRIHEMCQCAMMRQ